MLASPSRANRYAPASGTVSTPVNRTEYGATAAPPGGGPLARSVTLTDFSTRVSAGLSNRAPWNASATNPGPGTAGSAGGLSAAGRVAGPPAGGAVPTPAGVPGGVPAGVPGGGLTVGG